MPSARCCECGAARKMNRSASDALAVQKKAVFTDQQFDDRQFVYLASEIGEPVKRYVTIGKKTTEKAEVLEGLSEGDTILLEEPKTDP